MDWYFVGVDFGQSRHFMAIAVLERAETTGAWDAQNMYPHDPAGREQWWTNQQQADAARLRGVAGE
jgi:hypothetical protein